MGDREKWNEKYRGRAGRALDPPDAFVLAQLDDPGLGPPGRALDLAAGTGRHALELARRGWRTCAFDVSDVGLEILDRRAAEAGLEVETRVVDLLGLARPRDVDPFDLIVAVNFLDRWLLGQLADWVRPGGHLLLSTFTLDWPAARPPAAFRLERGEWETAPDGFAVRAYREEGGRAGLLARRTDS